MSAGASAAAAAAQRPVVINGRPAAYSLAGVAGAIQIRRQIGRQGQIRRRHHASDPTDTNDQRASRRRPSARLADGAYDCDVIDCFANWVHRSIMALRALAPGWKLEPTLKLNLPRDRFGRPFNSSRPPPARARCRPTRPKDHSNRSRRKQMAPPSQSSESLFGGTGNFRPTIK